ADARVRARSAVIEADDVALLDYQGGELSRIDDQLDFDPAIFQATDGAAWVITSNDDTNAVELDTAFSLLGCHAQAFGHWMWEYLPKYIASGLSGTLPNVPILIDAAMPKTHRQALELLIPDGVDVVELAPYKTARVKRLWCAPSIMYLGLLEKINER